MMRRLISHISYLISHISSDFEKLLIQNSFFEPNILLYVTASNQISQYGNKRVTSNFFFQNHYISYICSFFCCTCLSSSRNFVAFFASPIALRPIRLRCQPIRLREYGRLLAIRSLTMVEQLNFVTSYLKQSTQ